MLARLWRTKRWTSCGLLCALAACAHAGPSGPLCRGGLDGSFVQLGPKDMQRDAADWQRRLQLLEQVGARTIVLQYSGDDEGSYDARTPGATPVASLLTAADSLGMPVYLGLYSASAWPHARAQPAIAPPLADANGVAWLEGLCSAHEACSGWYIPGEIDERTWGDAAGVAYLREFLSNSSRALRAMRDLPIAIAPFYAESLQPEAYAAFWERVLAPESVDTLMLQDGAGARGTALARVETLLRALGPVLERKQVALWSVVELFDQTSGPPRSSGPFAAGPTPFEQLEARMRAERPWVHAAVGFSILDYMAPERGAKQAELYQRYAEFCRR